MKKFFIGILMAAALMFSVSSCGCNRVNDAADSDLVVWSAEVTAEGQGTLVVAFPSGGLNLEGEGKFEVTSTSDSLFHATPLAAENVLAAPGNYSEEQVAFAQQVQAAVDEGYAVTTAEGTWAVDINIYARQPQTGIVFVFVKHWPEEE